MNEIEVVSNLPIFGRPANVINTTTLSTGEIAQAPQVRDLVREMSRWMDNTRGTAATANMFRRDRYVPPDSPYQLMAAAKDATASDDIVGGVLEATTAIGLPGMKWEGEDADAADVFNQMSAELNLDDFLHNAYRDDFRYEQFVCAKLWGWSEFTVRGKTTKGNRRKKTYRVWCPQRLVILDSLKVVPIGRGPLRPDWLAWHGSEDEITAYAEAFAGDRIDPLMTMFFDGTYIPGVAEARELVDWGIDPRNLLKVNPEWVFRHTGARADHELFATSKLKSVFQLLDLKQQQMASDRATLIGAANYILLVKQGTDDRPGTGEEIRNLKENYNFLAKLPVIIADHRLSIEIIAPKTDFVLKQANYDVLDTRILARLLGTLAIGQNREASGGNTVGALVSKIMANRRHMIKRSIEREIARAVVKHPKNEGVFDGPTPSMVYTPRNVTIDSDQAYLAALLSLRTSREMSRETILEYLGLDEATEAQRIELEEELYDDVFKSIVPYSGTQPTGTSTDTAPAASPADNGRTGGRPAGGGSSSQSPAATAKPKTKNGNTSTAT